MFAIAGGKAHVEGNSRCRKSPGQDAPANIGVIIPAWQPDGRLLAVVSDLRSRGVRELIVVNDGSGPAFDTLFADLADRFGVTVCSHLDNGGKGRALKRAFEFVRNSHPELAGVVTADADGQHTAEDIVRVAQALAFGEGRAVLGVRTFTSDVPWRSRIGNRVARKLFALLSGFALRDTQTGLRGLPASSLAELVNVPGERYEYETVMLGYLCQTHGRPVEVPIRTVYLDGNRGSHFHPLWDSMRVYWALLRWGLGRWQHGAAAAAEAKGRMLHTA